MAMRTTSSAWSRPCNPRPLMDAWCGLGELRGELDHQLRLVQQQRLQLDEALALQQRSQRLLDHSLTLPPQP